MSASNYLCAVYKQTITKGSGSILTITGRQRISNFGYEMCIECKTMCGIIIVTTKHLAQQ